MIEKWIDLRVIPALTLVVAVLTAVLIHVIAG